MSIKMQLVLSRRVSLSCNTPFLLVGIEAVDGKVDGLEVDSDRVECVGFEIGNSVSDAREQRPWKEKYQISVQAKKLEELTCRVC